MECGRISAKLPPLCPTLFSHAVTPESLTLREDFLSHDPEEIRPFACPFLRHVCKVDYKSMMFLIGASINLFTTDVRENPFTISGIHGDNTTYLF